MHLSGQTVQTVIALGIVAAAACAVGRRLWALIAAFGRPKHRAGKPGVNTRPAPPTSSPLIQIQRTPPAHLKRPPADGP